ncbi:acyl-CoA dehydrogenase family protein [Rhizobacter sp. Root1221]|uniref:acyl-CoA dehydrogenase family protein n=1 Tax=Rhizobacter sp. Root1221 TaxID=1736433 RepID=UPI0006FC31A9|nr:acyl-CoA dehydrogenase family protein [Rhizobacter sp. Root1221]KQV83916.1 DNA alkylation response protein [Rhizobacter sp. Root1221]
MPGLPSDMTHDVTNVVAPLADYNLFTTDTALWDAVERGGGSGHLGELADYGALLGHAETLQLADDANRFKPELHTFDRVGHRIDRIDFHPAWHAIMRMQREHGLVSMPFSDPRPGAWAAYAAAFSMHMQIEAGSQCPGSMTFAAIPVLMQEPALFAALSPKLYSRTYDARDLPVDQKTSMLVGMGMTEKQGGSDLRANTTRAVPVDGEGRGAAYELTGHKWFFSAPQSDAHLVVAQAPGGFSCFYVPRFRPDGRRNAVRIQRLKNKVGNHSNASSEVEFHGAWGQMVGDEGRGIPTIIDMATYTRLNCVMGSAGLIRQAVVQAIHHTRHRHAFGKRLVDQPLMRNVLADMALESEAATLLMMRLTQAFARASDDPLERAWKRIVTPAAKFWVAKRSIELGAEAMEVFGGNGYVEDGPMGRLFREMPVISIWEGSGNVMGLDMLRAIGREPEALDALVRHLGDRLAGDTRMQAPLAALQATWQQPPDALEAAARRTAQQLVLLLQAALLRDHAPAFVADTFIASRFDPQWGRVFGTLPDPARHVAVIDRAWAA